MLDDEIQKKIADLPSLSPVIMDVLDFLNSGEEIDYAKLEKKIILDPSLMGRILGLANSPFFGMKGKISSIKDACFVLGLNSIRNVVISSAMIQQFPINFEGNLNFNHIWMHSIGTACAAKVLAKYTNVNPEQAFMAGLLHDLGKMALDLYFNEKYQKVVTYQLESECTITEAEEHCLGTNHANVGALIAEHWNLPEFIITAIRMHHTKDYKTESIEHVIQLSNVVSSALNIGHSGDPFVPDLDPELLDLLNMNLGDIENNLSNIEAQADSLSSLIK